MRNPIFIDGSGVLCAVGYLISQTLGIEYAKKIDTLFHGCRIKDMDLSRIPFVLEWANEYGLDLEDLAKIQPGYGGILEYSLFQLLLNFIALLLNLAVVVYSALLAEDESDAYILSILISSSIFSFVYLCCRCSLGCISIKLQFVSSMFFLCNSVAYIALIYLADGSTNTNYSSINILIWCTIGFSFVFSILSALSVQWYKETSQRYSDNLRKMLEMENNSQMSLFTKINTIKNNFLESD